MVPSVYASDHQFNVLSFKCRFSTFDSLLVPFLQHVQAIN